LIVIFHQDSVIAESKKRRRSPQLLQQQFHRVFGACNRLTLTYQQLQTATATLLTTQITHINT